MPSVHDNKILSYSVDLQNDELTIHTQSDSTAADRIDIIFTGVFNHFFEQPLKGSIILAITESPIEHFIQENEELLNRNKGYCWPIVFDSADQIETVLIKGAYKYITLLSSYGLNGWVLARDMEIIAV